ncbi:MAG: nucleotidyltransferase domain-containing protein [Planctomycetota bacterium]
MARPSKPRAVGPNSKGATPVDARSQPSLYVYHVLLTGIHLMRTGEVEANLLRLNETFRLPYIADLVAQKVGGTELGSVRDADFAFHAAECRRLTVELEAARDASDLPEAPTAASRAGLNDLLLRVRGCAPPGSSGPVAGVVQ